MLRSFLLTGLLLNTAADPAGGGGGAPPAPAPTQPFAVFNNQADLDARLERARRSGFRDEFGTEDPAEVKQQLARLKELEDAEKERKRAELSEQQKLQQDLDAEKARAAKLEQDLDQERFRGRVTAACGQLGIKNVKYALYEIEQAVEALPAGQQLDPAAHLKELLAKDEHRAAFGIPAVPVETQPVPVNTSPEPGSPPPAPPRGPEPTAPTDAMNMNPQQFAAHLARLGAG